MILRPWLKSTVIANRQMMMNFTVDPSFERQEHQGSDTIISLLSINTTT